VIILEGADKAGKTTTAKRLCEDFKGEYYHFGIPPPGVVHREQAIEALKTMPSNTIFDRLGLSGFVYDFKSPTDKDRKITSLEDVRTMMHVAKNTHTMLIYVHCSNYDLKKRFDEEGDANDYVNWRELLYVSQVYTLLVNEVGRIPYSIAFNTSEHTYEQFVRKHKHDIETFLR
jgi:polyphosphate kinase 2 (PPK2 family)